MVNLREIIRALKPTKVRMSITSAANLDEAVATFGLKSENGPATEVLVKITKEECLDLLSELLWKSMAYQMEIMPLSSAKTFANEIIESFPSNSNSYFTNRSSKTDTSMSWNPMTNSTFDCGIISRCGKHEFFCIWFEDED